MTPAPANRMLATLGVVSETILRAKNNTELFEGVAVATAHGGNFLGTAILMRGADGSTHLAASAGIGIPGLDARQPAGPGGVIGATLRSGEPSIAHDCWTDELLAPWHEEYKELGVRAAAAIPILCRGSTAGVLVVLASSPTALTWRNILALTRIADNVAFGLDTFDRSSQTAALTRMLSALTETDEAIMRSATQDELFRLVCEATIKGARFSSGSVMLVEPGNPTCKLAASAGIAADYVRSLTLSIDPTIPEGQGLTGTAYRTRRPAIANDFQRDPRTAHWHGRAIETTRSGGAFPLTDDERVIGVLLLLSLEVDTFTPEFVDILERLAANVSFALTNLARHEKKRIAERRIEYLASHDDLTGLSNRAMFNRVLDLCVEDARACNGCCAVMFIDIDGFKSVNDTLGHHAGDRLLTVIAGRLKGVVPNARTVARIGGDEFVIILDDETNSVALQSTTLALLTELSRPIQIDNDECRVSGSIGVAVYPQDGSSPSALIKHADMAMYSAKTSGKDTCCFFTPTMEQRIQERRDVVSGLQRALERSEFVLFFQPKVDACSSNIGGLEALIRWNRPDVGLVPPSEFVPIAEESRLIVQIGRWVILEACRQMVEWLAAGAPPITIAVNLSAPQFSDIELPSYIDAVLRETGLPARLLQIEITESMVMANEPEIAQNLDALRSRGIRLAIDDFGTGYSLMSLLRKYPIDVIKIDRAFVSGIPDSAHDCAITEAMITMAKGLGLMVVAEGVETRRQEQFLLQRRCDYLQGHLYCPPIPAADMLRLLLTNRNFSASDPVT
ncbi:hypothetical protein CWS35_00965 [Bradyrhizobium sp. SK17]|nr:EAL domain-containing protein [uncultured Bradyrhizobium sp.]AUC93066.1 hypothetical protein CWS35_00965 [Bradyrhizobium sp. SK17]